MTDAPEVIYLQWTGISGHEDNTWCVDEIHDDDVEYIKKEIANKQLATKDARIAELDYHIDQLNEMIRNRDKRIAELENEA